MALRKHLWALSVAGAPLVASCSFLLDFNELQRGIPAGPDAGGDASARQSGGTGNGGSSGAPGSGGASTGGASGSDGDASIDAAAGGSSGAGNDAGDAAACGCDDGDPCTVDLCESDGGCKHEHPGVVLDGLSTEINASAFHRVTMIASGSRFYLSAFETNGMGQSDVLFRDFGFTEKTLALGTSLSSLATVTGRTPVSTAGLVPGTAANELVAYVAMGKNPSGPAQVWRFSLDTGLVGLLTLKASAAAAADDNYAGGVRIYPPAWSLGAGEGYAAWPGVGSGVFVERGTNALAAGAMPTFATAGQQALEVAPLGTAALPGVLFMTSTGVSSEAIGQGVAAKLGQCDTRPGEFTSLSSAFTGVPGLWIGAFTKSLTSSVVTEETPLVCLGTPGAAACGGASTCSKDAQVENAVRNPALAFTSLAADPVGRVYEIAATPFVDSAKGQSNLGVSVVRVDLNSLTADAAAKTLSVTPAPVLVASVPFVAGTPGPDWPAIAVNGEHIGISWIQPAPTGNRDELHVARYRICFPN
jgi:hypothetical protein